MTALEAKPREKQAIRNIQSVLAGHPRLRHHLTTLQVTIENIGIVLRGELPSRDLRAELVPAVRSAGVLRQIRNLVRVANEESLSLAIERAGGRERNLPREPKTR